MKSFLKYVLATIVGVVIVNLVVCVFFVLFIGALAVFSEKTVTVPEGSVLTIRLDHPLQDRVSDNPMDNFDFFSLELNAGMGLNRILESIHCAATDNRIKGIYLNLGDIQGTFGGLATTKEIRDALEEFKESGKFIYSYSNLGYSQLSYYLATVADRIYVNPETPLVLTGLSSGVTFYKEALDKLGVQAEIVKVGKFKSAVEPYIATEMSDANREQVVGIALLANRGHIVRAAAQHTILVPEQPVIRDGRAYMALRRWKKDVINVIMGKNLIFLMTMSGVKNVARDVMLYQKENVQIVLLDMLKQMRLAARH